MALTLTTTVFYVEMAANYSSDKPYVLVTADGETSAYGSFEEFAEDVMKTKTLAFKEEVETGKCDKMQISISYTFPMV